MWLSSTSRPDSVANIVRPDITADIGGPTAWQTLRPDSVANIVRPDSVADIGGLAAWPTSAWPTSEACELRGQLQGPPTVCVANFKARRQRA